MKRSNTQGWLWLCAAWLLGMGLVSSPAANSTRPEILTVSEQKETLPCKKATPRHRARRLPSLTYDVDRIPSFKENFKVTWSPGAYGLPAGTALRFYYQLAAADSPSALEIRYPFDITTHRTATFVIPENVIRNNGPVTAWRVVLYRNKRILATRSSAHWK